MSRFPSQCGQGRQNGSYGKNGKNESVLSACQHPKLVPKLNLGTSFGTYLQDLCRSCQCGQDVTPSHSSHASHNSHFVGLVESVFRGFTTRRRRCARLRGPAHGLRAYPRRLRALAPCGRRGGTHRVELVRGVIDQGVDFLHQALAGDVPAVGAAREPLAQPGAIEASCSR